MIRKYRVKWRYTSSLGGPWMKGDMIELEESLGEAVNRDSPGVLGMVSDHPLQEKLEKMEEKGEEKSTERIVEGVSDRMVKGKGKR